MTPYDQAVAAVERGDLRTVDALVAEHVLGWRLAAYSEGEEDKLWCRPDGVCVPDHQWSPSKDVPAAWEVIDAVRARAGIRSFGHTIEADRCCAWFDRPPAHRIVVADTVPLAFCLAALRAVAG